MAKKRPSQINKEEQAKEEEFMQDCMNKLVELEDELGVTFTPLIHHWEKGSFTYIQPTRKPKDEEGTKN